MFKKSITTLCVTLASVLLFTSCANSSLKTLNFDSMMDIVSSYSEKEKYFLSTTTFKMSYTLIEDNSKIEGMYELDYDKDSYYLYHLVKSDDGVKERLIYKNEDNQYVEYIHGKNITSTENYVERMNEVRSVIKKYALYDMQIVNSEGNTYVFDTKKQILELNINDDYFKILNNGLISELGVINEENNYVNVNIYYSLKLNRRTSL